MNLKLQKPNPPKLRSQVMSLPNRILLQGFWKRTTQTHQNSRLNRRRYYDFNVRNHAQFVEKLHYIHWNPVKKGLCERPEDWPWSSFLHHATGGKGRVEIESEWTARQRERAAGGLCPAVEVPHSSQNQA